MSVLGRLTEPLEEERQLVIGQTGTEEGKKERKSVRRVESCRRRGRKLTQYPRSSHIGSTAMTEEVEKEGGNRWEEEGTTRREGRTLERRPISESLALELKR